MDTILFLNMNNEHTLKLKKIKSKNYSVYIDDLNIFVTIKKINRGKYEIYQGIDLIGILKKPMFGKSILYSKNNINCLLIKDECRIYVPPLCKNIKGFNSFISSDIKKNFNYNSLTIKNKEVFYGNNLVFKKYDTTYINKVKEDYFIFYEPLTIIQAIALIFL